MKSLVFTIVLLFSFIVFAQDGVEDRKEKFRTISSKFMTELKSVLMKNLKAGGAPQAFAVCSDTAQILTGNIGEEYGAVIKRVSFKARNPKDTPDQFEADVLKQWHEKMNDSGLPEDEEYLEVIKTDSTKMIRYMKPIFVQGPCLACHGNTDSMSDEVKNLLKAKYPEDKATGYKAGDLRGAISITKILSSAP